MEGLGRLKETLFYYIPITSAGTLTEWLIYLAADVGDDN